MVSGRAEPEGGQGSARRIRVLFLGANPDSTEPLPLDREARGIDEKIQSSKHRSFVQLIQRWAVRVDDLLHALLKEQPDVVHFSGHGTSVGQIILEGEDGSPKPISREAFAELFRVLKDRVRVVVLNASRSRAQAEAVARHIRAIPLLSRLTDARSSPATRPAASTSSSSSSPLTASPDIRPQSGARPPL
jgi:hypothetical protein